MVFKNLLIRFIFSLLILTFYLISLQNFYVLFSLGIFIYIIIVYEILFFFKKQLNKILIYVFTSLLFYLIYFYQSFDLNEFNLLVMTIVLFDSFSYVTGIFLGKNHPFKKISPKKTIEGYLGGVFLTNVFIFFILELYPEYYLRNNYLLFINIIILFSLLGDLIESFFKRINNIKNSSNFLPGHGGFFDRFDSFISSIFFVSIYTNIFNAY